MQHRHQEENLNAVNMILAIFIFSILHLPGGKGASDAKSVSQNPPFIIKRTGESVVGGISCSHKIQNYDAILWYKQDEHKALKLLGLLNVKTPYPEDDVKGKISFDGEGSKQSSFSISDLALSDSGVYFCAASRGAYTGTEAFFGKGTKLTVLEPNQTIAEPTVKVLKPCKSQKGNKTLVCVASKFYPDHVSVSWEIDDVVVNKTRVATDSAAVREGNYYSIKSMLRVSEEEWYTEGKKFRCAVRFYNGTDYVYRNKTILGKWKVVMNTEQYLKTTQVAKISYSVIIAKSCVYGAFVAFFVWKLQGSAGKQDD